MELNALEEIEHIRQLKARYFRLMDQKRWDEWRELFIEDVTAVYHGPPSELRYEGRTTLGVWLSRSEQRNSSLSPIVL